MDPTSPSLLDRLRDAGDADAWGRLVDVYTPLVRGWLVRLGVRPADADDLVQEVLTVVVRRFPEFKHAARRGAFRAWLKAIAVNCARDQWKAARLRPVAPGGTDFAGTLARLEDPDHPLSQAWDREHDLHVVRHLLRVLEPQFEAKTWTMFRRFVLDGLPADDVAAELHTTPNAVFVAKSRVMARLRREAAGMID